MPKSIWVGMLLCIAHSAFGQGETTSAIVGTVADASGGALPGAVVTVTDTETGARRSARTDEGGRFNFPQLKPGAYMVRAEAAGFKAWTIGPVFSGLGQKQTVQLALAVAAQKGEVVVNAEPPLVSPENPNTAITLSASALENLPNPGGDLTYPLQFAPGADEHSRQRQRFSGQHQRLRQRAIQRLAGALERLHRRRP